jgi:predicted GTPase
MSLHDRMSALADLSKAGCEFASRIGASSAADALQALQAKLDNPQLHICFVGRTSAGKTTLINTLLGHSVLPHTADPTTAVVVEVRNSPEGQSRTLEVNSEGKLRQVTKGEFLKLCRQPAGAQRLILEQEALPYGIRARIFDTPGYDSIYEQHTEVLSHFISQADLLVLVVLYRAGLCAPDLGFVQLLHDVFGSALPPIMLLMNRVPSGVDAGDRRIVEIETAIKERIGTPISSFLVREIDAENPNSIRSDDMVPFWAELQRTAEDPHRLRAMLDSAVTVISSALASLSDYIDYREVAQIADRETVEHFTREVETLREAQQRIHELVRSRKPEIAETAGQILEERRQHIRQTCYTFIHRANRWRHSAECHTMITESTLPREAALAAKAIGEAVYEELDKLDREVGDIADTAIGNFQHEFSIGLDRYAVLKENLLQKATEEGLRRAAFGFLARFGGRGGPGAGVANFSKMALKRVGKVFGKTFSVQTYNNLAKFLADIGATSTRAISAAVAVLVESAIYLYKVATWQGKLEDQVDEAISSWSARMLTQLHSQIDTNLSETIEQVDVLFDLQAADLEAALKDSVDRAQVNATELASWRSQLIHLKQSIAETC